jgi:hypothetical protein
MCRDPRPPSVERKAWTAEGTVGVTRYRYGVRAPRVDKAAWRGRAQEGRGPGKERERQGPQRAVGKPSETGGLVSVASQGSGRVRRTQTAGAPCLPNVAARMLEQLLLQSRKLEAT